MMIIYRIYLLFIALPLLLVATILTALITLIGSLLGGGRWFGYYPGVVWSRIFCWLTWVRVRVEGREHISKGTSYVFVANHQGAYDIFSIYGYLGHNFRWMMKKSLERIPLVGYSCKAAGHIFVDNKSTAGVRRTMEDAEKRLAGGMSVVVFPEGSRTRNGQMSKFRRGAFTLAVEFGLPVVPITIDGAFKVMPRTTLIPRPGTIKLTIHKPISVPAGEKHDMAVLMDESYKAVASALPQ